MMTSLRKVPGLSFGAFALFLACWLLFRGEEFVPSVDSEGAGATHLDARMSSPGHAVHAESAPGRMPLQRWVVQVLSREGEPLPGAVVRDDGAQYVAGDAGLASLAPSKEIRTVAVSCDGYMTEQGVRLVGELTAVRLRPAITIDIAAVTGVSEPVAHARFWVRPYRLSDVDLALEDGCPTAVTDAQGKARIGPFEFPEDGTLFLQGCHEDLAYCRRAQEGQRPVVFREAGSHSVTARFLAPRVVAVDLPAEGVVTWKTELLGNGLRSPSNDEARWTCKRISERIQATYPNAVVTVLLPQYPPSDDTAANIRFTLWLVGRQPFTVPCVAERAEEFVAPQKVAPPAGLLHDGFGSLRVVVADALGSPVPESDYRLLGDVTEDWPGDRSLLVKPKGRDTGGWMTLPTGTWRVDFYDAVLGALAKGQSTATAVIAKGGSSEVRVVFERRLVRCRFEASVDSAGPMPTAGVVRLVSEQFGFDIPLLRNAILQPFEFWLPEGESSLLVEARTTQDGPVLVGRTAASLRAGVAASPQVIRVLLAQKR